MRGIERRLALHRVRRRQPGVADLQRLREIGELLDGIGQDVPELAVRDDIAPANAVFAQPKLPLVGQVAEIVPRIELEAAHKWAVMFYQ